MAKESAKSTKDHEGFTLWFTGLHCCGKSTLADVVADRLRERGLRVERLDGDVVRKSLSRDLGFTKEDRDKNIGRIIFVSSLLSRNGVAVLTSFVSPYRQKRAEARKETTNFFEVYVKCSVEVCMERDVKGMYKKALNGEIKDFTGVSDPYEEPENPEIVINSDTEAVEESAQRIISMLEESGFVKEQEKSSVGSRVLRSARETHTRAWAKSVVWRVIGVFMLGGISWFVTHSWGKVTLITLIFHGVRFVLYYFHERVWDRVEWGKIRHPLSGFDVTEHLTPEDRRVIETKLKELGYMD